MSLIASALLCAPGAPVHGQSAASGALRGVVLGAGDEPIGSALLTLRDTVTGLVLSTRSGRDGTYRFGLVPAGVHDLTAEKLDYLPRRIRLIPVTPGSEVAVDIDMRQVQAAVQVNESAYGRAAVAGNAVYGDGLTGLPYDSRDVVETLRLASQADHAYNVDGLPWWYTALSLDGTLFRPAAHPLLRQGGSNTAFPLITLASGHLVTGGADSEWRGAAGGWLAATTRRGGPGRDMAARGDVRSNAIPGASFSGAETGIGVQGELRLAGTAGDSARYSAGLALRRLKTPVAAAWNSSATAEALADLGDSFGADFAGQLEPDATRSEAIAGFLRLDWNVGGRHRIGGWAHGAVQPQLAARDTRTQLLQGLEGTDLVAGASVASVFGARLENELRAGFTLSRRNLVESAAAPPSWIVDEGLALGGLRSAADTEELRVTVSDAVHYHSGAHAFKVGGGFELASYRYDALLGADGEVFFGNLNAVLSQRGLIVRPVAAPIAQWESARPFAFAQDRWAIGQGLTLTLGGRAERSGVPGDKVGLDREWERLSGLANDSATAATWEFDVRAGLMWEVPQAPRWALDAEAGLFRDEIDPLLLANWQSDAGTVGVLRELGTFNWPDGPVLSPNLQRVTLLAPGFSAPQTARGQAGASYQLSPATALRVAFTARRTENLPRRTDLNLLALPAYRGENDRAVYGVLQQDGALVIARPASGRRFESYDEAAGITADGWSEYWGATFGAERTSASGIMLIARYTFSRTRDNWFGGREGGWTVAAPAGMGEGDEWVEGVSDFDVPHRVVAALTAPLPIGARLGAVYRGESGQPFTPGFRRGVDANGDGVFGNDPAFVDASVPGMNEMITSQECLRDSRDAFAARNSCRGSALHALDLTVDLPIVRVGGARASVHLQAFDVFASRAGAPDAALFLVDANGSLTLNDVTRTVSLPLQLNPAFGEERATQRTGRQIRFGVSIEW